MNPEIIQLQSSNHGFVPGDEVLINGVLYMVASVTSTAMTLNPNVWQRAWFWIRRKAGALEMWMEKWDWQFAERYKDRW